MKMTLPWFKYEGTELTGKLTGTLRERYGAIGLGLHEAIRIDMMAAEGCLVDIMKNDYVESQSLRCHVSEDTYREIVTFMIDRIKLIKKVGNSYSMPVLRATLVEVMRGRSEAKTRMEALRKAKKHQDGDTEDGDVHANNSNVQANNEDVQANNSTNVQANIPEEGANIEQIKEVQKLLKEGTSTPLRVEEDTTTTKIKANNSFDLHKTESTRPDAYCTGSVALSNNEPQHQDTPTPEPNSEDPTPETTPEDGKEELKNITQLHITQHTEAETTKSQEEEAMFAVMRVNDRQLEEMLG